MLRAIMAGGGIALTLVGNAWATDTASNTGTPSASTLTADCLTPTSPGLSPTAISNYAAESAASRAVLAADGKQPKTGTEMILQRISAEVSYGNSALISEQDNSWVVDWDRSKWSYLVKVTVPLDIKHQWLREKSAAEAATAKRNQDDLMARSELVGKLLKLRADLAKGDNLAAEILAFDIAARSPSFARTCIAADWRAAMVAVRP